MAALADPDAHAGQIYRPTGPDLVSPDEIAAAIGHAFGRGVRYRNISEKMMLKALRAMPLSNYSEAAASQLALDAEEYWGGTFAVSAPTDHVERIGARAPEAVAFIVMRYVAARADLGRSLLRTARALAGLQGC